MDALYRDFLTYPFMQRMLIGALLVSFTCSLLSVFVVLRRMAFIGQGISHAAFGGIAFGLWLFPALATPDLRVYAITVAFCLAVAGLIGFSSRSERLSEDSAIGIFFVAGMAAGVIFLSLRETYTTDVFNYLFGTILAVNEQDLWLIGGLAGLVFVLILLNLKELYAFCFDEVYADTLGISTTFLHYLLLFLLALTIVLSVKVAGVILVTAFLVIPGACAAQMTYRFKWMLLLSVLIGTFTAGGGLLLSNHLSQDVLELPPSAMIVVVQFALFLLILLIHQLRRWLHYTE
jgi:ABC-type Mn2+/Zn2+ transport system permease subunit